MGCMNKNGEGFQKIEYICPECGELPPEISNINIDNKFVEFKCKICAEKTYNSQYFYNKKSTSGDIIDYYCKKQGDKFWFKEYLNQKENLPDDKNFLQKLISDGKFNDSKEIIRKKNEQLKEIIKFNEILIEECENNQNNYFYIKSLGNVYDSLKRENARDLYDLKFVLTAFKNDFEISEKEIVKFFEQKVDREKDYLFLNDKKLNDEKIECLALIQFNNLKDIDLSGNEIEDIEPLCNINLPFLEYLNLSNNKIKNIESLREITSKKFDYLFLHNNQIGDIQVLNDPNFRTFEILTLENNNINEFKELPELYTDNKKILVTKIEDEIIQKYKNLKRNENRVLELEGTKKGDFILKILFVYIIYNNNYKIKTLKLKGNEIKDPSILNRIEFKHLETLELSDNHIKSLDFLKGMKSKELQNLYLDNNYINDLSFLYNEKVKEFFPRLKVVSLKKNNFNAEEAFTNNLGTEGIKFIFLDEN